jgi:alpha-glucosidase
MSGVSDMTIFLQMGLRGLAGVAGAICLFSEALAAETAASPDGSIVLTVDTTRDGRPFYKVAYRGETIIGESRLGYRFKDAASLEIGLAIAAARSVTRDETWEQPWGERRLVRDHHNELAVDFASAEKKPRRMTVRFRVFDDGVAFRYEIPRQPGAKSLDIINELTEFRLPEDATYWWIPGRRWNRYEYLYRSTKADGIDIAHTPITLKTASGAHLSIHEAALVDYAAMALNQQRPGIFKADLAPWSDGVLVRKKDAFSSPWRTVQIAPDAKSLLASSLILNLNEPNALGDVSWVEPGKYVGVWWEMHIRDSSWGMKPKHGATTENTKRYIDFAAKHGFKGVLVEGWNIGWDDDWFANGEVFDFTKAYPDFDIEETSRYALEKGVRLIGHHETGGAASRYENQMEDAFALYARLGVRAVKTGYVADGGGIQRLDDKGREIYEWHDGQFMANHHLTVVKKAAEHKISINPHEPIKDTGLRRTYPNWIAREGARGQEYNAWGVPPLPPEHDAILPFTRLLSGPMDFTPGIFDLRPNERPPTHPELGRNDKRSRVETTLAKQLALYVTVYSPIQMAADLPENYDKRLDAFQFIKDVPTDWEETVGVTAEIGDYAAIARQRRGGKDWYLGVVTDENARRIDVPLGFLKEGVVYVAEIYRDGKRADYEKDPYDIVIEKRTLTAKDALRLDLGRSGGAAVKFAPKEQG